jgi:hypothetical protein
MTAKELQKRNERSQALRVVQLDDDTFYVESSEGKICYRVSFENEKQVCTCGDYSRGIKSDSNFKCKHIISVYNSIPNGDVHHGQVLERAKPKLNERFIIKIENKDFVQYAGLLDLGHQKGISQIEVDPIQLPTQDSGNFAICKATVISKTGDSFTDIGDANPQNCNSKVSRHLLRMASTRAIARALRSFTNIGMTCLEELSDLNDIVDGNNGNTKNKVIKQHDKRSSANPKAKEPEAAAPTPASTEPNAGNGGNGTKSSKKSTEPKAPEPTPEQTETQSPSVPTMSEAQKRAIYNLSRRRGISVVRLMTVHRSKGLEFPVVFLVGMVENILPSKKGNLEEERRICFVAISRAMKLLYLSHSKTYLNQPAARSPFLDEILGVTEPPSLS